MSEALIRKYVIEQEIEKVLKQTSQGDYFYTKSGQKKARKLQQKHFGQLVIVENLNSINAILDYIFPGFELPNEVAATVLKAGQDIALTLQENYAKKYPDNYEAQVDFIKTNYPNHFTKLGKSAFLVQHFGKDASQKGVNHIIKKMEQTLASIPLEGKGRINLTEEYRVAKQMKTTKGASATPIIRGHGQEGSLSVVQARAAITMSILMHAAKEENKEADLSALIDEIVTKELYDVKPEHKRQVGDLLKSVVVKYEQVADDKGLKASYVPIITLQDDISNSEASAFERAFGSVFFEQIIKRLTKDVLTLEGSSTLKEKATHIIFREFLEDIKSDLVNIKLTDGKKVPLKTSGTASKSYKKSKKKGSIKKNIAGSKKLSPVSTTKGSKLNLRTLIPILNQRLPQAVAANMHSPALNYRTGRFANSAKIVDITQTPKGFPSIAYDYLKTPYKLFEFPTGDPARATQDRDPRKIIDKSIREIAVGMMEGRFFTRRV